MATVIVTHRVSSFDQWKPIFDEHTPVRRKAGLDRETVHRDHSDPNLVTVIMHTHDLDAAKRFADSPDLAETMKRGGVEGPPDVKMLDDV